MKLIINLIVCLLLASCASQKTDNESADISDTIETRKVEFVKLPENRLGFWISESYLLSLQETKSTKKSQELGVGEFYKIHGQNSIMKLNMHEGGEQNILIMDSENKGKIWSADSSTVLANVEFKDKYLVVDTTKFIQVPDREDGIAELINGSFFSGKYSLGDKEVEFLDNGEIIGLDQVKYYKLNLDYYDAGMDFDKTYLQFKDNSQSSNYIYEFEGDTLLIYEIDCKELAEDNKFCVKIAKGKVKFKLKKVRLNG